MHTPASSAFRRWQQKPSDVSARSTEFGASLGYMKPCLQCSSHHTHSTKQRPKQAEGKGREAERQGRRRGRGPFTPARSMGVCGKNKDLVLGNRQCLKTLFLRGAKLSSEEQSPDLRERYLDPALFPPTSDLTFLPRPTRSRNSRQSRASSHPPPCWGASSLGTPPNWRPRQRLCYVQGVMSPWLAEPRTRCQPRYGPGLGMCARSSSPSVSNRVLTGSLRSRGG